MEVKVEAQIIWPSYSQGMEAAMDKPTGTERLQDLWTQANAHFQADAQRGDSYRRITILVS